MFQCWIVQIFVTHFKNFKANNLNNYPCMGLLAHSVIHTFMAVDVLKGVGGLTETVYVHCPDSCAATPL